MSSIQETNSNPNTNLNTNPNTIPDIKRSHTVMPSAETHQAPRKIQRQPTTAYRSFTCASKKQNNQSSDEELNDEELNTEINIFSDNKSIEYEATDLENGNKLNHNKNHPIKFGSIGTQSIRTKTTVDNDSKEEPTMPVYKVDQWESDRQSNNDDSLKDLTLNKKEGKKLFFDLFAVIRIGGEYHHCTFNNRNLNYNKKQIAVHSGDTTENATVRIQYNKLTGETVTYYADELKLRHTLYINVENLVEISKDTPVVVYILNAGYNQNNESNLDNYKPQETVNDTHIVDTYNTQKKYLMLPPIYSDDSVNHTAALVSMITFTDNVELHILTKYSHGIVTNPTSLIKKIETTYWEDLVAIEPSLSLFDKYTTPSQTEPQAQQAQHAQHAQHAAPYQPIRRSMAGPLNYS